MGKHILLLEKEIPFLSTQRTVVHAVRSVLQKSGVTGKGTSYTLRAHLRHINGSNELINFCVEGSLEEYQRPKMGGGIFGRHLDDFSEEKIVRFEKPARGTNFSRTFSMILPNTIHGCKKKNI